MRVFGFLTLLLLFGGISAHAEYPKPALDAYGALPQISSAEISPDGTKVAAIANIGNSTRAIIVEIGVGVKTQIGVEKAKARGISFYDNDHIILRASETISTFGVRNDYEYSGAFAIDLETLDINQLLIRTRELYPAQSGLGRIAGRGKKPGDVLMPAFTGGFGAEPDLDLMVAKLGSSRARRYMRGTSDTMDWFVGDGGRSVLAPLFKRTLPVAAQTGLRERAQGVREFQRGVRCLSGGRHAVGEAEGQRFFGGDRPPGQRARGLRPLPDDDGP